MKPDLRSANNQFGLLLLLATGMGLYCVTLGDCHLLTPDQQAYRSFQQGDYAASARLANDPWLQATALFKAGEFKSALSIYAGYDTPEGAYNQGNTLVMLGKYEAAIKRYQRALALKPNWEAAQINLKIARERAKKLEKQGGNMTGGKMEADEIVFTRNKNASPEKEEEVVNGASDQSAAMRAIWLRQVKTRSADFLKAKFAYQYQYSQTEPATDSVEKIP